MDERQHKPEQCNSGGDLAGAIRGHLVSLLLGACVCLYMGFSWKADAPGSVPKEDGEIWYLIDNIMSYALRIVGLLFLFAVAATSTGKRSSMLVVVVAEAGFTIMMFIMALESIIESLMAREFEVLAIFLIVLGIFGISSIKRSWLLYRPPGRDA